MEPYPVTVDPAMISQLQNLLERLDIKPVLPPPSSNTDQTPFNIVPPKKVSFPPSQRQLVVGVIPWSPPQVNWNPWTSCNIDEGPLANVGSFECCIFIYNEDYDKSM